MKYLFDTIDTNSQISNRFQQLFKIYQNIDQSALGFPKGWENEPLWTK